MVVFQFIFKNVGFNDKKDPNFVQSYQEDEAGYANVDKK